MSILPFDPFMGLSPGSGSTVAGHSVGTDHWPRRCGEMLLGQVRPHPHRRVFADNCCGRASADQGRNQGIETQPPWRTSEPVADFKGEERAARVVEVFLGIKVGIIVCKEIRLPVG